MKTIKTVFVFGNADLPQDSLPLKILPKLKARLPDYDFQVKDPNEEWQVPDELIVIDTAIGIDKVTVFHDLDKFKSAPRLTMHDFDALANLRLLKKLGRIKKIEIIGIPPEIDNDIAIEEISKYFSLGATSEVRPQ